MPASLTRSILILTAALLAAGSPAAAWAQGLAVGVVALDARHALLGDPLVGPEVSGRFARDDARLDFRIGVEKLAGSGGRAGVPCAGLIQPNTCATERVRDDARFLSATGGVALRVIGGPRATLALTGDLSVGALNVETRGRTSDEVVTAMKVLLGAAVGVEGRWQPAARVPLALQVAAAVGRLTPALHETVQDGYSPFERGFGVRQLRVGLAWQPRIR